MLWLLLQSISPLPPEAAAFPAPEPGAREVSWSEYQEKIFNRALALPMPTKEEVDGQPADLAASFEAWLEKDLALNPQVESTKAHQPVLVGDLILELRAPTDYRSLRRKLDAKARTLPGLRKQDRDWLAQMLATTDLRSDKWDPEDNKDSDGLLHLPSWNLDTDVPNRDAFWRDRSGSDTVLRTSMLLFADLQCWNEIENSSIAYDNFVGSSFEEVRIEPGTESFTTRPSDKAEIHGRHFYTRSDLPWPFSSYEAVSPVRAMPRSADSWIVDVYSESDDFHWFAGRDVFVPVKNSSGEFVCWLVIQEFGFDLDGVPESNSNRRAGVRNTLGNKKRLAEALFEEKLRLERAKAASPD